jgi:hypothetical protein
MPTHRSGFKLSFETLTVAAKKGKPAIDMRNSTPASATTAQVGTEKISTAPFTPRSPENLKIGQLFSSKHQHDCTRALFSRFAHFESGSPSKQAKRNSMRIKRVIESSRIFKSRKIWVERIVVFANQKVDLSINNSSVPILKVEELSNFIMTRVSNIQFTSQELGLIGKQIQQQS